MALTEYETSAVYDNAAELQAAIDASGTYSKGKPTGVNSNASTVARGGTYNFPLGVYGVASTVETWQLTQIIGAGGCAASGIVGDLDSDPVLLLDSATADYNFYSSVRDLKIVNLGDDNAVESIEQFQGLLENLAVGSVGGMGINLASPNYSQRAIIRNCRNVYEGCGDSFISIYGVGCTLDGNYYNGSVQSGWTNGRPVLEVGYGNDSGDATIIAQSGSITVRDNIIEPTWGNGQAGYCVYMTGPNHTYTGNHVEPHATGTGEVTSDRAYVFENVDGLFISQLRLLYIDNGETSCKAYFKGSSRGIVWDYQDFTGNSGAPSEFIDTDHLTTVAVSGGITATVHTTTTRLTLSGHTVSLRDKDAILDITGGTATAGKYIITNVDVANNRWVLDRSAGSSTQTATGTLTRYVTGVIKHAYVNYDAGTIPGFTVERVTSKVHGLTWLTPSHFKGSNLVKAASTWTVSYTGTAAGSTVNSGRDQTITVTNTGGNLRIIVKFTGDAGRYLRIKITRPDSESLNHYGNSVMYKADGTTELPWRIHGETTIVPLPSDTGSEVEILHTALALGDYTITEAYCME